MVRMAMVRMFMVGRVIVSMGRHLPHEFVEDCVVLPHHPPHLGCMRRASYRCLLQ